jgi:hypothetical protein
MAWNKGDRNFLVAYVDAVIDGAVIEWDTNVAKKNIELLKTINEFGEMARENYRWQRILEAGRAAIEEDVADARAKGDAQLAGVEIELKKMRMEAEQEELRLRKAEATKKIEDLSKPSELRSSESEEETIRAQIRKYQADKAYARETIKDETELKEEENFYDDKIATLREKLRSMQ